MRPVPVTPSGGEEEVRNVGVFRMKEVDEFLTALPYPGIQQIAQHDSILYDPSTMWEPGSVIIFSSLTVPKGMTQVITDVKFFGTVPSENLAGQPRLLGDAELYGLFRFGIQFNRRNPMQIEGNFVQPTTATTIGLRSGWPFLNQKFGVERTSGFAIYAGDSAEIQAGARVDGVINIPLFSLGVRIDGFTLPTNVFSGIWEGGV